MSPKRARRLGWIQRLTQDFGLRTTVSSSPPSFKTCAVAVTVTNTFLRSSRQHCIPSTASHCQLSCGIFSWLAAQIGFPRNRDRGGTQCSTVYSTAPPSSPSIAPLESVRLLLCEFWQLLLHIHPRLLAFHKASDCCTYRVLIRPNLLHTISISKCKCIVLD